MTARRGYTSVMRALPAALLLASLPWLTGCEGGCGEPEKKPASAPQGAGASGGTGRGGGGEVAFEPKAARQAGEQPAGARSTGKGVPYNPPSETSAAGRPLTAVKLRAACRAGDPGCKDLRAAVALARRQWRESVAVVETETPGPELALFSGQERVSGRSGLPFAPKRGKSGEPLETTAQYRERLKAWLLAAVKAGDLTLDVY